MNTNEEPNGINPPPDSPTAFRRREFLAKLTRPLIGGGILIGGGVFSERAMASGCTECDTYQYNCSPNLDVCQINTCGTDLCLGTENICNSDTCVTDTCTPANSGYDECAVANTCQQSNYCNYDLCTDDDTNHTNSNYCNGQNQCVYNDSCSVNNMCNTNVCSSNNTCGQTNSCASYNTCDGGGHSCSTNDYCPGTDT